MEVAPQSLAQPMGRPMAAVLVSAALLLALVGVALPAAAVVSLTVNVPSPAPAGTTTTWRLTGDETGYEAHSFSIAPAADPSKMRTMYDFQTERNEFDWTPIDQGSYFVIGRIRNLLTGAQRQLVTQFQVGPRVPAAESQPVVTATEHPLVAFYSAPACPLGLRMRVRFFAPPSGRQQTTHAKPCNGEHTMNFYVAGMRRATAYAMFFEIIDTNDNVLAAANPIGFGTGPAAVPLPLVTVTVPAGPDTSTEEDVILQHPVGFGPTSIPLAVDLEGEIIWYYDPDTKGNYGIIARPGGEGTFWSTADPTLTKWDLLGNILQQTTVARLNEQLRSMGLDAINNVHHEARPLPGGRVAVLGTVEKLLTDEQGPGEVDVLGDMLIVLDENLEIVFTWNGFDHLDTTRLSSLGRTCPPGLFAGCPPVLLIDEGRANDWMHTNTVTYSPAEGDLLLSVRDQDWVVKINYADGAGDGSVEWLLGAEGDFDLSPADPDLWFSHQHDVNFVSPTRIVLYDNNNVRCDGDPLCVSRGQALDLDEVGGTATLALHVEFGEYAAGAGSAQPLLNDNSYFNSGFNGEVALTENTGREYLPDGTLVFEIVTDMSTYRQHRMTDMYRVPIGWAIPQD